ncbi:MAG TPA: SDR family oxidoreductase [Planctomycetaceae bacterium]|nr:SDR family oxidoreductase [Planctomycetaceae bacterium]
MILDLFQLNNRVALVTGANRGLGQAMALGLAEAGADIACVSRSGDDATIRGQVEKLGRRFLGFKVELADPAQREGLVDKVVAGLGQVDILVNNAGTGTRHSPEVYPMHEWRDLLEVHLNAAFDLAQQAALHMLPRGRGKIINIGSVMSFEAGLNLPAYAAAKHGLAGLTKSLAVGWSSRGINVNCIAPGYFETNMATSLKYHPVRGQQILDRIPAGRWGMPEELKGLAVFLASDASNYMHGSVVPIDGGWLAR